MQGVVRGYNSVICRAKITTTTYYTETCKVLEVCQLLQGVTRLFSWFSNQL